MNKDIRDAFFDRICEYAIQDKNVIILTDDIDIFSLQRFKKEYPDRFLNPGVAEQHIINMAAGLAASGKKVMVCGIGSFVTMRCFEQIKVNICSMGLPVIIVGLGIGLSFAFDGPTHHGINDVAIMRTLPEIEIFNPIDERSSVWAADIAYASKNPCYVRIDKGIMPDLLDNKDSSDWKEIAALSDLNILTTGYATQLCRGLISNVGHFDICRLKPIDEQKLMLVARQSKGLITIEEHMSGGLFSIVAEILSVNNVFTPLKKITLRDGQYLEYGSREWLCNKNGLSSNSILSGIYNFMKVLHV